MVLNFVVVVLVQWLVVVVFVVIVGLLALVVDFREVLMTWAGSAWLGDKDKIQAWLGLGSTESEIFVLRLAWARNRVQFTN